MHSGTAVWFTASQTDFPGLSRCQAAHFPPTSGSTCRPEGRTTRRSTDCCCETVGAFVTDFLVESLLGGLAGGCVWTPGRTNCHGVQLSPERRLPWTPDTHE